MTWPQIGEYTENGITVRVMKAASAFGGAKWATGIFPSGKREYVRNDNPTFIKTGYTEPQMMELRF
jgi:hypothetical protein